ncbi:hypothetical protein [Tuwongella immobilis]|uniref:Uncharacterized protein n=1 Tax=Tuwongella immobilis TaxID=692036 RepID=A0A6C2YHW8_9BACT|nr:hypothetical protein [Tuwongella immobilis]VIP00655.1 unnamed protein product [Tuwongella immobilis]VTR96728.1 unnamed protein product [Tuwongella immobilis]
MSDREIDTMNLSFIDLICCALGGLLLLLLFFASLVSSIRSKSSDLPAKEPEARKLVPTDIGFQRSPPEPMIVRLHINGRTRYPVQLRAFPPRLEANALTAQQEFAITQSAPILRLQSIRPPGNRPMNPAENLAQPANGPPRADAVPPSERFVGFFTRSITDQGSLIELTIPRGRSLLADQFARLNSQTLLKRHDAFWRFEVSVLNPRGLEQQLNALQDELTWAMGQFAPLEVHTQQTEVKPGRTPPRSAGRPVTMMLTRPIPKSMSDLQPMRRETVGMFERITWLKGFDPQAISPRDQRLLKLWWEQIVPLLPINPPPQEHTKQVNQMLQAIEQALEQSNRKLPGSASPQERLEWEDLLSGPIAESFPNASQALARVRRYGQALGGTDPNLPLDRRVPIRLTVSTPPWGQRSWVPQAGESPAELSADRPVWFGPVAPPVPAPVPAPVAPPVEAPGGAR